MEIGEWKEKRGKVVAGEVLGTQGVLSTGITGVHGAVLVYLVGTTEVGLLWNF